MYCPNCANKVSLDQRFCRSCGLALDKIAQSLGEQLPTTVSENLLAKKDKLERLGVAALSVFGLGVLGLILYGIVYQMMIMRGRILGGLALLGLVILGVCGLLSVVLFEKAEELKKTATQHRLPQPAELPEPATTAKLLPESHLEPLPSVTERTTDLLFAEKKDGATTKR
ncbi:MAG TPA: zinc ribbon domain-containing protein [Pyrinomonadaceae bacterium]|nr:zinc ribbon domain-containing protein [Pyrinomonadaceae bacterium]